MMQKSTNGKLWKRLVALSASCMLLGTSCGVDDIQAVVVGLETVSSQLDRNRHDEDTTFGEWLLEEINDL